MLSVVPSPASHMSTYLLLESAGIPAKNRDVVTYESGGKARAAVAGGQVDFTILSAEGSEGVRDMVRPLAIVRDTPLKDWEAATPVNEALKPMGIQKIGRASCRERVCQYVSISVVAVSLKKKKTRLTQYKKKYNNQQTQNN